MFNFWKKFNWKKMYSSYERRLLIASPLMVKIYYWSLFHEPINVSTQLMIPKYASKNKKQTEIDYPWQITWGALVRTRFNISLRKFPKNMKHFPQDQAYLPLPSIQVWTKENWKEGETGLSENWEVSDVKYENNENAKFND